MPKEVVESVRKHHPRSPDWHHGGSIQVTDAIQPFDLVWKPKKVRSCSLVEVKRGIHELVTSHFVI